MAEDDVSQRAENDASVEETDVAALIQEGVTAIEAGRRDDAESAFRKALALEPDNSDALRRLGVVVYMGGDYEDARGLLDLAIGLAPDSADALNNLAAILLDRGETTEAETYFRRALALESDDSDIHFNLGLILLQRENFVEARSCFEAVIASRPDDADAHHNLAMTWRRESGGQASATAISGFRKAIEIDGDDCDSLLELSVLLREEGSLTEALATSERVLKSAETDARADYNHGSILYDLGRFEDAARFFQRALSADAPDNRAHDHLGRSLAASGDMDGAVRAFRRGLEIAPDNHRIRRNLRDAYSRLVPSWYLPTLTDSGRNEAYRAAIEKVVRKGDVVLDIGAGSGLLAMMAARAGAEKVVACELSGSMAEMSRRIVARNGFEDVVTVLPTKSNELTVGDALPAPADVVIAENLDVTLIGEGVVPALRHATRHLMRPGAKVIPVAARVFGALIEWPGERAINPVQQIGGFDFSEFDLFRNPNMHVPFDETRETHRALSEQFEIAAYDFQQLPDFSAADQVERLTIPAVQTGTGHAVLVWFELDLDDDISFSTRRQTNLNHWHQTAQFLDRDLTVRAGDDFVMTVRRTDTRFCFEAAD